MGLEILEDVARLQIYVILIIWVPHKGVRIAFVECMCGVCLRGVIKGMRIFE